MVCLHLCELLLGVLHARVDCVSLCICLLVSHRCVSLLVRVWALDVWGQLVPSKIFNPPFPVLKAGHSVSYSYICDVCLEWVNEWVYGGFYSFLFGSCAMHTYRPILYECFLYPLRASKYVHTIIQYTLLLVF